MLRWQHILCILSPSKAGSLDSKCKEKEKFEWDSAPHSSNLCGYRNFISKKPWMDILGFYLKLFLPRYMPTFAFCNLGGVAGALAGEDWGKKVTEYLYLTYYNKGASCFHRCTMTYAYKIGNNLFSIFI